MPDSLARFREGQEGSYDGALAELSAGRKQTHWMWYVFPQIAGLGRSPTARHFAIRDAAEAAAYLADPVLGARLIAATEAATACSGRRSLEAIFGPVDALKFASSMTLFEHVAGVDRAAPFAAALDGLADGRRDRRTIGLLSP